MDQGAQYKIIRKGFLEKRSKYLKNWKKRFIVLTDKAIFAYTGNEKDSECTMDLLLSDCSELKGTTEDGMYCIHFINNDSPYILRTTKEEGEKWFKELEKTIQKEK